jgi:hypothetical protein
MINMSKFDENIREKNFAAVGGLITKIFEFEPGGKFLCRLNVNTHSSGKRLNRLDAGFTWRSFLSIDIAPGRQALLKSATLPVQYIFLYI